MKDYGIIPGYIQLNDILEEQPSLPGYLNKSLNWDNKSPDMIFVYLDEGNIPHCHVNLKSVNKIVCVRLDKAEYFIHGQYKDKFNKKERKVFNEFMKSYISDGFTRWNFAKLLWNASIQQYEKHQEITISKVPDYSKLETE